MTFPVIPDSLDMGASEGWSLTFQHIYQLFWSQHGLGFFILSIPQRSVWPNILLLLPGPAPNHGCRLFLFPGALWPSSLPQLLGQVWKYLLTKKIQKKDLIVYTYNPSTGEEGGLKFQAVLGRIVNCRPAQGTV